MPADPLDKLVSDLNRRMMPEGAEKPAVVRRGEVEPVRFIPSSSFALNYLLGGGYAEGKLHEFFGQEHSGKTTLALLALMDLYRYYDGRKAIVFIDVEHRFNTVWAENLGVTATNDFILVQPPNAEMATDAMSELIQSKRVCGVVFDSVGGAAGWREQQTFEEQSTMYGGVASVMARNVKTIAPLANLYNCTCFYLNQLRADMQGYNRPMTPGGHAVKHGMSVRVYLRRGREKYMQKTVDGDVQVGYPMVFKTVKNSFGPAPREQWSDLYYYAPNQHVDGIGFDTKKELQRLGILTGVVTQSGSWYEYGSVKSNGRDAFFRDLESAGISDQLAKDVMATLDRHEEGEQSELPSDLARPETDGVEVDDPDV